MKGGINNMALDHRMPAAWQLNAKKGKIRPRHRPKTARAEVQNAS